MRISYSYSLDAFQGLTLRDLAGDAEANGRIKSPPRITPGGVSLFPRRPHMARRSNYQFVLRHERGNSIGSGVSLSRRTDELILKNEQRTELG